MATPRPTIKSLQAEVDVLRRDLTTIAEMIVDAAREYDLCNEFDDEVDNINSHLSQPWLKSCRNGPRTFTVTVETSAAIESYDLHCCVETHCRDGSDYSPKVAVVEESAS